jgi:hypothetical protein
MTQLTNGTTRYDLSCREHSRNFIVVERASEGGAIVPAVRLPCGCVRNLLIVEIFEKVGDELLPSTVTTA